jgi:hypothetical protein
MSSKSEKDLLLFLPPFLASRTFQMGGIFGSVSYLSITASDLSDQLLKDFLDISITASSALTSNSSANSSKSWECSSFRMPCGAV